MKSTTSRRASFISSMTDFSRSSNSPRNFAPGDEARHVQRKNALVPQRLRHVAGDDALRKPLGDGRLAERPPHR